MYMNTKTVNIALPKELLKKIDEQAKREYRNRSELIRESLRMYLNNIQDWEEIFAHGEKQAKKLGIKSEEDVNRLIAEYRRDKKR